MLKRAALLLLAVPVQAMNVAMAGHFLNLFNLTDSAAIDVVPMEQAAEEYECPYAQSEPYTSVHIGSDGSVSVYYGSGGYDTYGEDEEEMADEELEARE
ncbi:MAG: hypothetical protein KME03_02220 [Aphanocapsa lilacina HA4352-LM1]|jgi:hypothetical protein|nr:hypothetical protein [Aphanocapsa lilacina HA4352-LM1]